MTFEEYWTKLTVATPLLIEAATMKMSVTAFRATLEKAFKAGADSKPSFPPPDNSLFGSIFGPK